MQLHFITILINITVYLVLIIYKQPYYIVIITYAQDPTYPFIFYECIRCCWHQEQSKRPPANEVLGRLSKFRSSLLNKYTLEAPSSVSSVTIVFANHIQSLWAVMEYPCRSHDNPAVTKTVELKSIQQYSVTRLEIKVSFDLSHY